MAKVFFFFHVIKYYLNITLNTQSIPILKQLPIWVAPASRAFSTSSFTAVARFSTTWPEQMRCTDPLSMALIAFAGPAAGFLKLTTAFLVQHVIDSLVIREWTKVGCLSQVPTPEQNGNLMGDIRTWSYIIYVFNWQCLWTHCIYLPYIIRHISEGILAQSLALMWESIKLYSSLTKY